MLGFCYYRSELYM